VGEIRRRLRVSLAAIRQVLLNPDLRRLEIAWTLSIAAQWALIVALLIYAYDLEGALGVGLLGLARTLPTLVGVPLATSLGDRRSRVRVLVGVYLTALASAIVAAVALALDAGLLALMAIAAVNAIATAAIRPLQNTIIPGLARSPEELVASNVASSTGEGIGLLVGPAFGGLLLVFGTPVVALAGAVGMALATVAVTQIRPDRRVRARSIPAGATADTTADAAPVSAGFTAGLRALRTMPTVLLVMALFGVQPFVRGALTVLIVVASIELLGLGDAGVGLLNAAIGLGGIVGSIGTILLVGRHRLAVVFLVALVVWGAPISVMGLVTLAWVAVAAMVVVGVANAVLDVAGFTTLQRIVPNDVRASVLGTFEGYVAAMAAVGGIVAPLLIAWLGIAGALVVTGAILPLAVLITARGVARADDIALVPERQCRLLRGVAMFAPLPLGAIEELASGLEPLTFSPNEDLMRVGEAGDRFIIIDSGTVEVMAEGAPVRTIGPGGYCGEIALLRGVPRTATVRAVTDVTAFGLRRADFVAVVTGDREAARSADRVVDARLANEPDEPA
jgi:MFS family permease